MLLLLISGSTRAGSTNTAVLQTVRAVAPATVTAVRYAGLSDLPAFNPDDDHEPLPAAVVELRRGISAADALLVCTPEYAGALPGSLKNLLDWTVGGVEMNDRPVAWINAARPHGGGGAHAELATVLGYVDARVVDAACLRLPVSRDMVGPDGAVADPAAREQIAATVRALVDHVASLPAR